VPLPIRAAIPELAATELRFLVTDLPIKASSKPPDFPTVEISPVKSRSRSNSKVLGDLLTANPKTTLEFRLQGALVEKLARNKALKGQILQVQAALVLNLQRLYCGRVRRQLNAKEVKAKKGKKGGRINGEGLPRLLTSDEFYKLVEDHELAEEEAQRAKEARKVLQDQHDIEVLQWEEDEEKRKKQNDEAQKVFESDLEDWERRRKEAKVLRVKLKDWDKENLKPKKADYLTKARPRPKLKKLAEIIEEAIGEDSESTDEDEDAE
ncbi:hypothetical protein BJ912DRAFT_864753, partial [Pholiota molesta]